MWLFRASAINRLQCPPMQISSFTHNTQVPGMSVPQHIRDRMAAVGGGPAGVAEGVAIAKELLDQFTDEVLGLECLV